MFAAQHGPVLGVGAGVTGPIDEPQAIQISACLSGR